MKKIFSLILCLLGANVFAAYSSEIISDPKAKRWGKVFRSTTPEQLQKLQRLQTKKEQVEREKKAQANIEPGVYTQEEYQSQLQKNATMLWKPALGKVGDPEVIF